MVLAPIRICPGECNVKYSLGILDKNGLSSPLLKDSVNSQKKKVILGDFSESASHRVKIKEREKCINNLKLTGELEKAVYLMSTVI